jgi:hypothetical protein
LEAKIEDVLGEDKFGFSIRKGTGHAYGMLRIISKRTLDIEEESCACLIDWHKTFYRLKWTKLMEVLKGLALTGVREK